MTIWRNHPGQGSGAPTTSVTPAPERAHEARRFHAGPARSPRDAPLPHQEPAARASYRHRATVDRASGQADRPGGLVLRRHLVVGVRHRADAPSPDPDHRRCRLLLGRPHQHRGDLRPSLRDPLLSRGGQGVHEGRRSLRGGPRELRPQRGPGGRHVAAHRLHLDGRSLGGGRRGRGHLGRPEPHPLYDVDRHRPGHSPCLWEPARHSRGRPHVRRPHLLLHRQHGAAHRRGDLQGRQPGPSTPIRSPGTRARSPSGRREAAFSTEPPCSCCSRRSPREARP